MYHVLYQKILLEGGEKWNNIDSCLSDHQATELKMWNWGFLPVEILETLHIQIMLCFSMKQKMLI